MKPQQRQTRVRDTNGIESQTTTAGFISSLIQFAVNVLLDCVFVSFPQ